MTVGIMQPYLLPYIGYFQLIDAVDKFVIYDNIEYTKKGWINRNRILNHQGEQLFSVPIKKDSDYLMISERRLADDYLIQNQRTLRKIEAVYRKSPFFEDVNPMIKEIFMNEQQNNLFDYISYSLRRIMNYLEIQTEIIYSSSLTIDHSLKGEEKVKAICKYLDAERYINSIGGQTLYSKDDFLEAGLKLQFLKSDNFEYRQFNNDFIPWLSIIDVLMFNSKNAIQDQLQKFKLI